MEAPIAFPPPALVGKVLELGLGSGPWSRAELEGRWGESSANKFIAEAKNAGWLVSPFTNSFFVPTARDLMVVNWLAGAARDEFIISRMLAAAGVKAWCLSAWARAVGIETSDALFVTDLAPAPTGTSAPLAVPPPPPKEIASRNRTLAKRIRTLPFVENVILVPYVPQSRCLGEVVTAILPSAAPAKRSTARWIADTEWRPTGSNQIPAPGFSSALDPRLISYPLTFVVDDVAWILAFVGALGLPRFNEVLPALRRTEAQRGPLGQRLFRVPFADRIRNWAGLFSPPEPNVNWRTVFQSGRAPYLLVPSRLWDEFAGLSRAQRFQELSRAGN